MQGLSEFYSWYIGKGQSFYSRALILECNLKVRPKKNNCCVALKWDFWKSWVDRSENYFFFNNFFLKSNQKSQIWVHIPSFFSKDTQSEQNWVLSRPYFFLFLFLNRVGRWGQHNIFFFLDLWWLLQVRVNVYDSGSVKCINWQSYGIWWWCIRYSGVRITEEKMWQLESLLYCRKMMVLGGKFWKLEGIFVFLYKKTFSKL